MLRGMADPNSRTFTLLLGVLALGLVVTIILFPDPVFQSSLRGLRLWWEFVFPALMPFMIISELLTGFGFIAGLGVLLDPLMRRVFGVPGMGGWAVAMGVVGGYPLGAAVAVKLAKQENLSRDEAERLIAVSHLCNPMIMVAVIGAGFLHSAEAGLVIAAVHYAGSLAAGQIMRLSGGAFAKRSTAASNSRSIPQPRENIWARAFERMKQAYAEDGRTFGKLLGDAVSSSVQNLMMIGGLIMMFSVLISILTLKLPQTAAAGWLRTLLPAVFETHLGAFSFSQAAALPLSWKAAYIGLALGWSGLSAHLQVTGITRGTNAHYRFFATYRLLHGICAFALTLVLWQPFSRLLSEARPTLARLDLVRDAAGADAPWTGWSAFPVWSGASIMLLCLVLTIMLACSRFLRKTNQRR